MRIAIVHDQLAEFGGAERVLVSIKSLFPTAPVFTTTFSRKGLGEHSKYVTDWDVRLTWFGKIPIINRFYSPFRFLTPLIWEKLNLKEYDLIISSTGSWMCKGVITNKNATHISYIHHPPRYLYGYETAIEWQKNPIIKVYGLIVNHFLRMWDFKASQRPNYLIANSIETKRRIEKFYRRDSVVIYPPVALAPKPNLSQVGLRNYYVTVSRLARAKHIDVLIKVANAQKFPLHIVGIGRDETYLKSIAGPTITFCGNLKDEELRKELAGARAFLFASVDEEFGIAPVEAMSHGVPVIAYASGGLKETVKDSENGYLYDELTDVKIAQSINRLNALSTSEYETMCRKARTESEQYSEENFKKRFTEFVTKILNSKP